MKTFTAAILVAAACLLAASGAVEASRVGPARQLTQFNGGLGEFVVLGDSGDLELLSERVATWCSLVNSIARSRGNVCRMSDPACGFTCSTMSRICTR